MTTHEAEQNLNLLVAHTLTPYHLGFVCLGDYWLLVGIKCDWRVEIAVMLQA